MPRIKKAVIPAAGLGTRQYPASSGVRKEFFPLVDADGYAKPVIHMVAEEALAAAEEACIVCQPGAADEFARYFSAMPDELRTRFEGKEWAYEWSEQLEEIGRRLTYVEQPTQEGLGHAVWCARRWVDGDRFLVLLGDHIYVSHTDRRCSQALCDAFEEGSVTALLPVPAEQVHRFGVVRGELEDDTRVRAEGFIEKPDIETVRRECRLDGVPQGRYLAHFGMHVFTPAVLDVLDEMIREDRREDGEFQLTTAQDVLCRRETYHGLVMDGAHFDMGTPAGMLEAQMALALSGRLRDEMQATWKRLTEEIQRP
ncbi:MAG: sugar phosphate nucleotidyltransferase [Candidatus Brocadiia bacterium]